MRVLLSVALGVLIREEALDESIPYGKLGDEPSESESAECNEGVVGKGRCCVAKRGAHKPDGKGDYKYVVDGEKWFTKSINCKHSCNVEKGTPARGSGDLASRDFLEAMRPNMAFAQGYDYDILERKKVRARDEGHTFHKRLSRALQDPYFEKFRVQGVQGKSKYPRLANRCVCVPQIHIRDCDRITGSASSEFTMTVNGAQRPSCREACGRNLEYFSSAPSKPNLAALQDYMRKRRKAAFGTVWRIIDDATYATIEHALVEAYVECWHQGAGLSIVERAQALVSGQKSYTDIAYDIQPEWIWGKTKKYSNPAYMSPMLGVNNVMLTTVQGDYLAARAADRAKGLGRTWPKWDLWPSDAPPDAPRGEIEFSEADWDALDPLGADDIAFSVAEDDEDD